MHNNYALIVSVYYLYCLSIFTFSILLQNCNNNKKKDYKYFDEIT